MGTYEATQANYGLRQNIERLSEGLDDAIARIEALEAKATPAPEPRPRVCYVDELACDGTEEIRWWGCCSNQWMDWYRVTAEADSDKGQAWRYLIGPNVAMHRDEVVQVRQVMDPQTGDMLGGAA